VGIHRGAEILFNCGALGVKSVSQTPINPSTPQLGGTETGLTAIQAASSGDTLTAVNSVTITYGNNATDTYVAGQTATGRYVVSDASGNVVSYPT
jgi:hypothetical protein